VTSTPAVLRASLEQLLAGPTGAERAAGFTSWFSEDTAGLLASVVLGDDGTVVVDLGDLRAVIPNASSSAGSRMLLAELDATVFQFSAVQRVRYLLEGDCDAWGEWLQRDGCESVR
jgi:spore germination protein GerM